MYRYYKEFTNRQETEYRILRSLIDGSEMMYIGTVGEENTNPKIQAFINE
jgi:hypothetical protein